MTDLPTCPTCGAPFEERRKWNGGNPVTFMSPTCECEEDKLDAFVDRLIARRERETQPPEDEPMTLFGSEAFASQLLLFGLGIFAFFIVVAGIALYSLHHHHHP